jgi:thymidylate synthase
MITNYEHQYVAALRDIYENGFADGVNERTGLSTKRLPGIVIRVDVEKEFPILKSKRVFAKTADREIDWIMRKQSNDINDLNAKIWDEWADPEVEDQNGTNHRSIGKAYGYQVAKPVDIFLDPIHKTPESFRHYDNQVAFVLEYLKELPNGRWAKINLWNVEQLSSMNLVPCCHGTDWNLDGGRLNCVLHQRSGDMPYGVPFNTTQYAMLMCKFARHLGVKPGILTHVIADAHIYANQMGGVKEQLAYYEMMCKMEEGLKQYPNLWDHNPEIFKDSFKEDCKKLARDYHWETSDNGNVGDVCQHFCDVLSCNPRYEIPEGQNNFWTIDVEQCKVTDYVPVKRIDFGDIAV